MAVKYSGKIVTVTVKKCLFYFLYKLLVKGDTVTFKNPQEVKLNIILAVFISIHFIEGLPFLQKHDKHENY